MAQTDQTALLRRATWVGLRTLRQRPKIVGQTRSGEPVFEIKSVRLVLRDEAGHFSRLAECSKCGREVPGAPVMSPADLDRPAHSVICKDCVRAAGVARPAQPERRALRAETPAAEGEETAPEPAEAVDDVRLAALELQLAGAMSRLAELADIERFQSLESRLHDAVRQGLAEIRAEMSAAPEHRSPETPVDEEARRQVEALTQLVQAQEGRLGSLSAAFGRRGAESPADAEARRQIEALAHVVQTQQGRLGSLSTVVEEIRTEVQRLAAWRQEVAGAQADLERRIGEAAANTGRAMAALEQRLRTDIANLAELVESSTVRADLERRIDDAVAQLSADTTAVEKRLWADTMNLTRLIALAPTRDDLERRVDEALAQVLAEAAALEQRLGRDVTNVSQLVDTLRADAEGTLGAPLGTGLAMLVQAVEELTRSRDEIKAAADLRMEALGAAVEDGGSRLRDLEVRMDRAIDRLTAALEDHQQELKELGAATYRLGENAGVSEPGVSAPGDLLDGLEQQLQRAQSRLARLTAGRGGGTGPAADG